MVVSEFRQVVVAMREPGELLISFFDGATLNGAPTECVALLVCSTDVARALLRAVGSCLKEP